LWDIKIKTEMKFIVSSSYLLKQLQVLGSVINSSNTLPILDNFLFELDNNRLIVSASDLETTMSATLEIDSAPVKEALLYRQTFVRNFKNISGTTFNFYC
jgi:DNA polymerase III sliding clamp (beta) subunit (PCNA family)